MNIEHEIENPLFGYSKGQTMQHCSNTPLFQNLVRYSVSCSKSGAERWDKKSPGKNCGCCYPCLMRRAALYSIDLDDGSNYNRDAISSSDILHAKARGRDLRCILKNLNRYANGKINLFKEVLLPGQILTSYQFRTLEKVISDGLEEMKALIVDKGCKEVKKYAGLK